MNRQFIIEDDEHFSNNTGVIGHARAFLVDNKGKRTSDKSIYTKLFYFFYEPLEMEAERKKEAHDKINDVLTSDGYMPYKPYKANQI